jgi:competence protein ComEC
MLASIALISLAVHPLDLSDPGFQLTFGATAGILLLAPRISMRMPSRWGLSSLVAASLAAQAVTFPIVAVWFHRVVPYALVSNLLAVPLGATAVILGVALLPADLISEHASTLLAIPAGLAVRGLLAIASVPVEGTILSFRVAPPGPLLLVLAGCGIVLLTERRRICIATGLGLLACTLGLMALGPLSDSHETSSRSWTSSVSVDAEHSSGTRTSPTTLNVAERSSPCS